MGRLVEHKTPQIKQLRTWHARMARFVACGTRPSELARLFGYTESAITTIISSPLFEAEVGRLVGEEEHQAMDIRASLEMLQPRSLTVIAEDLMIEGNDPKLRKIRNDSALEILDRTGYGKKIEPQQHLHLHAHKEVKEMSDEDLAKEALDLLEEE